MQIDSALWILIAYSVGTIVGMSFMIFVRKRIFEAGVEATIDQLIDSGYLKAETTPSGEIILLKVDNEV